MVYADAGLEQTPGSRRKKRKINSKLVDQPNPAVPPSAAHK